jgi:ketosteroid isomerase-like protein
MAHGNIETVRSLMEAMKRDDVDAMGRLAHADYEFHTTSALPGADIYRGLQAVMTFSRAFNDTWETFSIEAQQVSRGEDKVVILGRVKAKGKASGVVLETSIAYVHTLREEKLARTEVFFDHDAALRAAGLAASS